MPLKGLGLMTLVKLKFVNGDYPAVIGTFEALTAAYGGPKVFTKLRRGGFVPHRAERFSLIV